ncbi:CLIP-associating protein 1 [Hondaea fermentalgiana]|uniref:CLIP-associating protein 1 n=1 Tax=Hondaea fermentalgiana TaxID=2315210 RepID=A0A2R5G1Q3_9STRA|nr:CLIP-associating protein 1 [Hondaea fermentalgiana]|eukprot:GBG24239.1 CLIP-associating protein 1 [Hondaea fermentalgiana]
MRCDAMQSSDDGGRKVGGAMDKENLATLGLHGSQHHQHQQQPEQQPLREKNGGRQPAVLEKQVAVQQQHGENDENAATIDLRELARECEFAIKVLEKKDADWSDRGSALQRLGKAAERGAAKYDEFLECLIRLRDPLLNQIKELRSVIVKEACSTFAALAAAYQTEGIASGTMKWPPRFSSLAYAVVEACLKQTCVSIKVISEAADSCIRAIISSAAPLGVGKILSRVCEGCSDKAVHHRLVCVEYIDLALRRWPSMSKTAGNRRMAEVRAAVKSAINDADDAVRRAARACYWVLRARSPEIAEQIMAGLDAASQRRLRDVQTDVQLERGDDFRVRARSSPRDSFVPASNIPGNVLAAAHSPLETPSESGSEADAGSFRSDMMMSFKTSDDLAVETGANDGSRGASARRPISPAVRQRAPLSLHHQQQQQQQQQQQRPQQQVSPPAAPNAANSRAAGRPLRAGPQRVHRAPAAAENMGETQPSPPLRTRETRTYQPGDYAETGGASTASLAGRATRTSATAQAGARRVGGAQRIATRPIRAGPTAGQAATASNAADGRTALGSAMRVEPGPSNATARSTGSAAVTASHDVLGNPKTLSSAAAANYASSVQDAGAEATPASLNANLRELESNPHWSARKDAVDAIMNALIESPNGFSSAFAAKLIPALCNKAADERRHHKVAQEVLKCICLMLPKHAKEFSDYLKQLLPALLAGTKDGKLPIRRFSGEAMDLCLSNFPHDQLAAMLSELCKQKGDSKRLAAMSYLQKVIPTTRAFFANSLHVYQIVRRVDRSLSSRNLEMRKAATSVLVAVYRYDSNLFLGELCSSEMPSDVRERAVKAGKDSIQGFESALRAHEDAPRIAPAQPSQHLLHQPRAPKGTFDAASLSLMNPVLSPAKSTATMETEMSGADTLVSSADAHDAGSDATAISDENATAIVEENLEIVDGGEFDVAEHETSGQTFGAASPPVSPETRAGAQTSPQVARHSPQTAQVSPQQAARRSPQQAARRSPQMDSRGSTQTATAQSTGFRDHADVELRDVMQRLQMGSASERELALQQIEAWAKDSASSHAIAWDHWAPQLAQACAGELKDPTRSVIVQAFLTVSALARFHPRGFQSSLDSMVPAILAFLRQHVDVSLVCKAKETLVHIAESVDPQRLLPIVLQFLGDPTVDAQDACIDMLRVVLRRLPTPAVLDLLTEVHPVLIESLDHEQPRVRKAATFLFVELNGLCGATVMHPYLAMLKKEKRTLVEMYVKRGLSPRLTTGPSRA